ncbi:Uu.00g105240.m01.CDS01 [Anthostomella pinea]|uniref:Uu.00g105240.m01.CDS01 n=1 Tax=Anthostomella pinea TaxID=933095 RepID=A0AAI8VDZ6_9PEZI|nr:Uu.00g105240.m01.CDS01 [Anthostomella pinea]
MCYQLLEIYSACRCLYYQHSVDRCAAYGRPGHGVTKKTILVGYQCQEHSQSSGYGSYAGGQTYSDSGYYSGQSAKDSRRQRR